MSNWAKTIVAKSDQLNADDLIGGEVRILKITGVTVKDTAEQPAIINYEGDSGKPFKPCKTVCRLIAECWGLNESDYVGRSMAVYRDDSVTWAGQAVGGIRVKALSHIKERIRIMLQVSKGKKIPFTVEPLKIETPKPHPDLNAWITACETEAGKGTDAFRAYWPTLTAEQKTALKPHTAAFQKIAEEADIAAQVAAQSAAEHAAYEEGAQ